MNEELLDKNNKIGFFSSESNNIFIFENISWFEVTHKKKKKNVIL
jgi:hypothetical protein